MSKLSVLALVALVICTSDAFRLKNKGESLAASSVMAGVAKLNATLPLGAPLGGFNHGPRRVPYWPIPVPRKYTTWMEPSVGTLDPNYVKALVIDDGTDRVAFVTMDAIGCDGTAADLAYAAAVAQGFSLKRENVVFGGSHTHSGPAGVSPEFLWEVAPAMDLIVPELQSFYVNQLAAVMVKAEQSMQPAKVDIGVGQLIGVTQNRRGPNPWVRKDTIDPNLGVIRVDTISGQPLATLWNFASHGTCYGPENMKFSSDILGAGCDAIEQLIGGTALFFNADAGDIDPTDATCSCTNGVCTFAGAAKIAAAVKQVRDSLSPSTSISIKVNSQIIPFGETNLNLTLSRLDNCTKGGPLDICSICRVLNCDANIHLGDAWVETDPRFTAFRFDINGKSTVMVTLPGEPLIELGWQVRNDTLKLGFDQTFLLGYSNNHMGYFATPNEYMWGGYESELTFWGIGTTDMVRNGCKTVAAPLAN